MQLDWDDLRTILTLVRQGSLAAAANTLGVNYTTVARRVRRAEKTLGQKLFERLPDGYSPNDAAHLIAKHAILMEDNEHDLMRKLAGRETDLSGTLTITAPQLLIANFLSPMIDQFIDDFPQVNLRILATNELLDLSRREADLAIRISNNPGDALKGRRILRQHSASYAAPKWAARIKRDPTAMIDWLVYDAYPNYPKNVSAAFPNNRVRLRMDDMVAMVGAAQAGLGVLRMPMFLGRATSGLVEVPVLPPQPYPDIWLVAHPDVWPSSRLRAFLDPLIAFCKSHEDQFRA